MRGTGIDTLCFLMLSIIAFGQTIPGDALPPAQISSSPQMVLDMSGEYDANEGDPQCGRSVESKLKMTQADDSGPGIVLLSVDSKNAVCLKDGNEIAIWEVFYSAQGDIRTLSKGDNPDLLITLRDVICSGFVRKNLGTVQEPKWRDYPSPCDEDVLFVVKLKDGDKLLLKYTRGELDRLSPGPMLMPQRWVKQPGVDSEQ